MTWTNLFKVKIRVDTILEDFILIISQTAVGRAHIIRIRLLLLSIGISISILANSNSQGQGHALSTVNILLIATDMANNTTK